MAISSVTYKGVGLNMRDVTLDGIIGYLIKRIKADPMFHSKSAGDDMMEQLSMSGAGIMIFEMDDYLREEGDKAKLDSFLSDFERNACEMSDEQFCDWLNQYRAELKVTIPQIPLWEPGPEQRAYFRAQSTRIRNLLNEQVDPEEFDKHGAFRIAR